MSEKNKNTPSLEEQIDALSTPGTRDLAASTAARGELIAASKAAELSAVPADSLVTVRTDGGDFAFHKPKEEVITKTGQSEWKVLTADDEGHPVETPVVMIGAAANPDGTIMIDGAPEFKANQYFVVGTVHRFKQGSEAGVPTQFSSLPPAEQLDPAILQENLNMGLMEQGEDGAINWRTVTETVLPPVQSVVATSLEGVQPQL